MIRWRRRRKPTLEEQLELLDHHVTMWQLDLKAGRDAKLIIPEALLSKPRLSPWARFCAWVDWKLAEDSDRVLLDPHAVLEPMRHARRPNTWPLAPLRPQKADDDA